MNRNSGMLQVQASNGTNQSENKQKSKIFSFSATLNSLGTIDRLPEFRFRWNSNEVCHHLAGKKYDVCGDVVVLSLVTLL